MKDSILTTTPLISKLCELVEEYLLSTQCSYVVQRRYQNKIDWKNRSSKEILSEYYIREFQDCVDWEEISYEQVLSEDFIREFKDRVDWSWISRKQVLLEDFIREFQDRWILISCKYCPKTGVSRSC